MVNVHIGSINCDTASFVKYIWGKFVLCFITLARRSSSSGDSTTRMLSCSSSSNISSKGGVKPPLQKRNSGSWLSRSTNTPKFLWIRLALFERILAGIIEHLVDNHEYVKEFLYCTISLAITRSNFWFFTFYYPIIFLLLLFSNLEKYGQFNSSINWSDLVGCRLWAFQ